MVALAVGIVLTVLGILGLVFWFGNFIVVLIGSLPFVFVVCGLAAIVVGASSLKDKIAASTKVEEKKEPEEKKKPEENQPSA